ncbi:MAG: hypothetical protein ACLQDY_03370 [Streptosporangiaceae bacterium]
MFTAVNGPLPEAGFCGNSAGRDRDDKSRLAPGATVRLRLALSAGSTASTSAQAVLVVAQQHPDPVGLAG